MNWILGISVFFAIAKIGVFGLGYGDLEKMFYGDFRRELLSRTRLSHRALKMKSSSLLTDGALAEWEASLEDHGWICWISKSPDARA